MDHSADIPAKLANPGISIADRSKPLPLSAIQEQILLEALRYPDRPVFNEGLTIRFGQKIDKSVLENALNALVERHEIFRTTFAWETGQLFQIVNSPCKVDLPEVDFRDIAAGDRQEEIKKYASQWSAEPFDLQQPPLIRAFLGIADDEDYRLFLTIHHLATDNHTLQHILPCELDSLYQEFKDGKIFQPAASELQYVDFAVREVEHNKRNGSQSNLEFWSRKLTEIPCFELPTDHARPKESGRLGRRNSFDLGKDLSVRIRTFCQTNHCEIYDFFLSAYYALLHRITGESVIQIGTVVSGRDQPELENVAGCFQNNVPLAAKLDNGITFNQLLDQVRCSFREAREHQHVSLSVLAQRLAIERDSSRHPFYQTLFAMDKPREKPSLMWKPSRTDFHPGGSKLDITLEMFECGESIQGQAEFDMELFKPETIDQLTNQYQSILEGILENPDASVSTLNLLDTQEREKILYQFNNTEHPIDPCLRLHDGLTRFAEGTPQAVAVADPERTLTYAELERQSNSVAGYLQAHNIGPDDVVGVLAGRSVNLMVALFGVLKAGAGYLPVVPTLPRERIEYLLSDSDAKFVLTDDLNLVPPAYSGPAHTIADLIKSAESFKLEDRVEPHHLAYVIYTSGSTGKPKGTMIEHRSIVNRILWMADFYGFTSNDVMIQKTTISFDVSLHELFTWSFCGARLFLPPPETEKDPDVLLEVVKDQGITFMNFVPSMLNGFLNYLNGPDEIEALRSVRIVYCSGEALPPLTARKFQKLLGEPLGIELHNLYGPTEAAVEVTAFDCADLDSETEMPIGKPIWNTRLYILDENMRPLPIGVPGELYIGGVQVSRGYLNRPELNEKTFIPDPFSEDPEARLYRTGDQARWLPDGNVVYLGRRDFQIKIRGIRIEPGEIEAAILEHPRITGAAVTSFKNTNAETQIAAYFTHTGSPFEEADYQRLKEDLAEKLTEQMMPVFFQELDAFPLNASGKLDRKALPEPKLQITEKHLVDISDIEDPLENILASIWTRILGVQQLDRQAGFFESGGHSLSAIQMLGRIRNSLNISIGLSDFLQNTTFKALLSHVRSREEGDDVIPGPKPRNASSPVPVSWGQRNLWFIQQLDETGVGYNIAYGVRMQGSPDTAKLEAALMDLVHKHEALRSFFPLSNGEPIQMIRSAEDTSVSYVQVEHEDADNYEERCRQILTEEWRRPFDLEQGPLFLARIITFHPDHHLLTLSMHHIICDENAEKLIYTGLSEYFKEGAVKAPELQLADFAIWERSPEFRGRLESKRKWWKENMEGAPASLNLPTDFKRKDGLAFVGDCVSITLPEDTSSKFVDLVRKADATLFIGFQAAWAYFLGKISRSDEVVVGAPVSLRTHHALDGTIGFLLNTLPFRVRIQEEMTFAELISKCREFTLGAYHNLDLPFSELVELLEAEGSGMGSPLFQVLLVMSGRTGSPPEIPGVKSEVLTSHPPSAKFELTLFVSETDRGIELRLEYRTDLFKEETICQWLEDFTALIHSIVERQEAKLLDLRLVSEKTRSRQNSWSRPSTAELGPCSNLADEFEECAEIAASRPALLYNNNSLDYATLSACMGAWSQQISETVKDGVNRKIGICMKRSAGFITAALSIMRSGSAYVPMDPDWPENRLAWCIQDAQLDAIVGEPEDALPKLREILLSRNGHRTVHLIPMDPDYPEKGLPDAKHGAKAVAGDSPAYIIYTSGSTGKPKGVVVPHRSAVASTRARNLVYQHSPERFLLLSPPIFDSSVAGIFWTLLTGGSLILPPKNAERDPQMILDLIRQHEITHILCLPSIYENLLSFASDNPPQSLKTVIVAGETCPDYLPEQHRNMFPGVLLYNEYGPTEGTVWCTAADITNHPRGTPVPIGKPVPHSRIYVVDEQFRELPRGARGELVIGGDGLATGYQNQPELTRTSFFEPDLEIFPEKRVYRTGDIARWLETGNLEFCGRKDDQLKVRGYRIEPSEIENVLNQHPDVKSSVVVVLDFGESDKRLAAYFTSDQPVEETNLKAYLSGQLPNYMVPFRLVQLDAIPVTSNGKVDKSRLPRPEATIQTFEAPQTSVEKALASLFQEILKVPRVGINDSFFHLGGNSLHTIHLAKRVKETFGNALPIADIFRSPTVGELSRRIGTAKINRNYSMKLAGDGNGLKLFFLPGIMRNPLIFKRLAEKLNPHTTSYGIELPPPEDGKESLKSLDAIGSHCMREIKKIQPEGPYILAGFSFGGVVAYETARKIHEKDGSINTLLMFDTFLPVPDGKNTIPVRSWPWFKQMLRLGKLDSLLFLIRNTLLVNLFWRWGYLDGPERPWNRNPGTIEAGTPPLNPEAYPFKEPGDLFPFNLHLFTVRQSHFTRKGVAEILNWNNYGPENLHHTWVKTDYHLRILDDEHLDSIRDSIFALHASK